MRHYKPGDLVVYRVTKHGPRPGPRAENILPASKGEDYSYQVDKYWIVVEVRADGTIVARTRRGKQHVLDSHSPQLRPARWWERLLYGHRFPKLQEPP